MRKTTEQFFPVFFSGTAGKALIFHITLFFILSAFPAASQERQADIPATAGYADKAIHEEELKAVEEARKGSEEEIRKLETEADHIAQDKTQLNVQLISMAQDIKSREIKIQNLEQRLQTLSSSEKAIRKSLESRRDVIAEVLAALQRIGRRPPPAVLARPEDMLQAVRTSILMGAVLPELKDEIDLLVSDLEDLNHIHKAVDQERLSLRRELEQFYRDQQRLAALMEARQKVLTGNRQKVVEEKEKVQNLATRAQSLKELIESMEMDVEGVRIAAAAARELTEASYGTMVNPAAFSDPARLAPKTAFVNTRGMLPMPVSGTILNKFGEADGFGGTMRGISLETRANSIVVSPADCWVAFAGTFRSFGRLLILNAGDGYYLLLAGMEQINVNVGQFVLAGEPVAIMGEKSSLSPVFVAVETDNPVLYVEFRKGNGSVDPQPWWAKIQSEKVPG